MTLAQIQAQARKIIEATTTNLCHRALHITAHYGYDDVFVCIDRMTDIEWTSWTKQPAFIRPLYVKLSQKGDGWRDLVQLAFAASERKQAKMVVGAAE